MSAIGSIQGARDERIRVGLQRAERLVEEQQYHLLMLVLTGLVETAASAYGSQQFAAGQDSARSIYAPESDPLEVRA